MSVLIDQWLNPRRRASWDNRAKIPSAGRSHGKLSSIWHRYAVTTSFHSEWFQNDLSHGNICRFGNPDKTKLASPNPNGRPPHLTWISRNCVIDGFPNPQRNLPNVHDHSQSRKERRRGTHEWPTN